MPEITDPNALAQLNATGDDFLKQIAATHGPGYANLVKATAQGASAAPSGMAMRTPFGQQLTQDVYQYDPTADAVNLPARVTARKAFLTGTQGKNYLSIATALDHSAALDDAITKLGNVQSPIPGTTHLVNGVRNAFRDLDGNVDVTQFQNTVTPIVDELERAYTQTGGSVTAINDLRKGINLSQSTAQQRTAVQTFAKLLSGKLDELNKSYNLAMGTVGQTAPGMTDEARQLLAHYTDPAYVKKGLVGFAPPAGQGGGGPDAPPAGPAGSTPPQGPIDPSGQGDIGFATGGGPATAASKLSPQDQADFIALIKDPKTTPADMQAFLAKRGFSAVNADDVTKARDAGLGVNSDVVTKLPEAAHPDVAGSFAANAANSLTFGALPKLGAVVDTVGSKIGGDDRDFGDLYNRHLDANNATLDNAMSDHPIAALGGSVAGFVGGDAALGAIPGVARLAARIPDAVRPLAGDALYGAAYGAGSSDSLSDIPGNVAGGAALSALGGATGRGILKGAAAIASPVANDAVRRLNAAGVTMTPGQILGAGGGGGGRFVKGMEDRATSIPGLGDLINATRRKGTEEFNRAAINDALAPIGHALPEGVTAGHEAIAHAQQAVSDAYDKALTPIRAPIDNQIQTELSQVGQKVSGMPEDQVKAFTDIMDNDVQPFWPKNGVLRGDDMQAIKQGLDKEIARRGGPGASPSDQRLADRLSEVRDAVLNLAGRADPANAAEFQKANQAYSLLSRVNGAAAKGKDGVFTPNMFRQAVTKRGYGTSTANVARGSAPMQQLATDASTVLPSNVPDSGTAGRLIGMSALGLTGAGAGYSAGGVEGAALGAGLTGGLYAPGVRRVVQSALAGSRGKTLNTLGDLLRANASLGGATGAPLLLEKLSK